MIRLTTEITPDFVAPNHHHHHCLLHFELEFIFPNGQKPFWWKRNGERERERVRRPWKIENESVTFYLLLSSNPTPSVLAFCSFVLLSIFRFDTFFWVCYLQFLTFHILVLFQHLYWYYLPSFRLSQLSGLKFYFPLCLPIVFYYLFLTNISIDLPTNR